MQHIPQLDDETRAALAREVATRGLQPVARDLKVCRASLANVIARAARPSTEAVVALSFQGRQAAAR